MHQNKYQHPKECCNGEFNRIFITGGLNSPCTYTIGKLVSKRKCFFDFLFTDVPTKKPTDTFFIIFFLDPNLRWRNKLFNLCVLIIKNIIRKLTRSSKYFVMISVK